MTVLLKFVVFSKCDHFAVRSHTKSSQTLMVYFQSVFSFTSCQFYNEEEAKKYSQK